MLTLGTRIRQLRNEYNIKQGELAQRAGLTQSIISLTESDASIPSLPSLVAIANAFGLPLVRILKDVYVGECAPLEVDPLTDTEWKLIDAYRRGDLKTVIGLLAKKAEVS